MVRLREEQDVATLLSSLSLVGVIVCLTVRLVPVARVRLPLVTGLPALESVLPRCCSDYYCFSWCFFFFFSYSPS